MRKLFIRFKLAVIVLISLFFLIFHPRNVKAQTVVFQDDFNDGDANGWIVPRNSCSSNWQVIDGKYGIVISSRCLTETIPSSFLIPLSPDASYSFEVGMTMPQSTNMDRNFVFKYQDSQNWYDIHTFGTMVQVQKVLGGVDLTGSLTNPISSYPFVANQTYHFKIDVSPGLISVYIDGSLNNVVVDPGPYFSNSLAGLQASSGGVPNSEVWFDNVVVTELTPEPTPTPTPTPTPPPPPTTKVVVVPGLGASWNADAILGCYPDLDPTHWSLASYAEAVYNPILTALPSSGWDATPFYYDWRQQVAANAGQLSNTISGLISTDEKVNLVGHSMGGLLGRAYLEQEQNANRLESLLTVGSPHQGTALAYPAWEGGDIWEDNFLNKIAMTILLKRCGGLFSNDRVTLQDNIPSIQNLLPTYNYLRDKRSGNLKLVSGMVIKNNWPSLFSSFSEFFGVRVGSLSGSGFDTLNIIPIRERTRHDKTLGNWLDGKPAGKENVLEGDGTVLVSSSLITGVDYNQIINQTHSGLMASSEGISEILGFLGAAPLSLTSSTYEEPKSTLILIGHPADFWITDTEGENIKSKDGLVSFMDPKSGDYKLNLLPKSEDTLFIVAQFLPNGRVLWKEYNLKGKLPKIKNIRFDSTNPLDDPVN